MEEEVKNKNEELNIDQKMSIITTAVTGATGGGVIGAIFGGPIGTIIGGVIGAIVSGYSDYQHHPHHIHNRRGKTPLRSK